MLRSFKLSKCTIANMNKLCTACYFYVNTALHRHLLLRYARVYVGKTITVLSLMLRTKGRLPQPIDVSQQQLTSAEQFAAAEAKWSLYHHQDKYKDMNSILRQLMDYDDTVTHSSNFMSMQFTHELLVNTYGMTDYATVMPHQPPQDLVTIQTECSVRADSITLQQFRTMVYNCLHNAVVYHSSAASVKPVQLIADVASELLVLFNTAFTALVNRLQPQNAAAVRLSSLVLSAATLIITPSPLLQHWQHQLLTHSYPSYLGTAFFDTNTAQPLPDAQQLAQYSVVVTTLQRLTQQRRVWQRSPLSKILFQRMVIDEGHSLGKGGLTDYLDVALKVEAQCRWLITGTPTPDTTLDAALKNVKNLLHFLRAHHYTDGYTEHVRKLFSGSSGSVGYSRLYDVLSLLMVRHTKAVIADTVPAPLKETVLLELSPIEAQAYDSIVAFVQINILLTYEMQGKTSGFQDSILSKYLPILSLLYGAICS
jgi:SNF2-related domain